MAVRTCSPRNLVEETGDHSLQIKCVTVGFILVVCKSLLFRCEMNRMNVRGMNMLIKSVCEGTILLLFQPRRSYKLSHFRSLLVQKTELELHDFRWRVKLFYSTCTPTHMYHGHYIDTTSGTIVPRSDIN